MKPLLLILLILTTMKILLTLAIITALTSCAITFDTATGKPVLTVDPNAVVIIVDKGVELINENLIQATK